MTLKLAKKQTCKKCIVVFICLLIVGNSTQGVVLCFGEDGHVSLEIAFVDCCDECSTASGQASPDLYTNYVASTNSCGNCIDIPLLANDVTPRLTPVPKKTSTLKVLSNTNISLFNIDSVSTHVEFTAKLGNIVNYTLASICTTVLII
jgi:hypothetical protein